MTMATATTSYFFDPFSFHSAISQDRTPMSSEPLHRLSTKEAAEKIMEKEEKNHDMDELLEAPACTVVTQQPN